MPWWRLASDVARKPIGQAGARRFGNETRRALDVPLLRVAHDSLDLTYDCIETSIVQVREVSTFAYPQ